MPAKRLISLPGLDYGCRPLLRRSKSLQKNFQKKLRHFCDVVRVVCGCPVSGAMRAWDCGHMAKTGKGNVDQAKTAYRFTPLKRQYSPRAEKPGVPARVSSHASHKAKGTRSGYTSQDIVARRWMKCQKHEKKVAFAIIHRCYLVLRQVSYSRFTLGLVCPELFGVRKGREVRS